MQNKFQALFQTYTFNNGITVKNRLTVSPMTHWSADEANGGATQQELDYLASRARGFGMFIAAATAVNWQGRGFLGEPNAIDRSNLADLQKRAAAVKGAGALAVLQLHHAGKEMQDTRATHGAQVVAPSADHAKGAREITPAEIEQTIADFARAAELALQAGFDGVEIHGANNYLLQQFLSPKHNRRTDEWGGSLENRLRFPLAVTEAVIAAKRRHKREDFIIGYRTTPEEAGEAGLTMADTLALAEAVAKLGVQYFHVSLQGFDNKARRGADTERSRLELVHERLNNTGVALIGVGKLTTPEKAADAFAKGWVEFVAVGMGVLANPDFALLAKKAADGGKIKARKMLNLLNTAKGNQLPDNMWNQILGFVPKPVVKITGVVRALRRAFGG